MTAIKIGYLSVQFGLGQIGFSTRAIRFGRREEKESLLRRACIILLCCLLSCMSYAADGPASFNRDDIKAYAPTITEQLRSSDPAERQKALDAINAIAQHSSRGLSDWLPNWTDLLLQNGRYDDVYGLSETAIIDRGFDITTVEKLEEARVQALIGHGNLDQALSEAKALYCVCVLSHTSHATDVLCNILERQGKSPVAAQLRFEQTESPPTSQPAVASVDAVEGGLPLGGTVLSWIKIDSTPWQETLNSLAGGGHTLNDFMKEGNLALLADQPDLARKRFESACQMTDGSSPKSIREAVEGIARSIRAKEGSAAKANAFIVDLRQRPEIAGILLADSVSVGKLKSAAQQTILAPIQAVLAPPQEKQREISESQTNGDKVKISFAFECATPMLVHRLSPTHFELSFMNSGVRNWFMVRVEGASGQTLRFDIKDNYAPLDKWLSFNPVYSYEKDLSDLATFASADASQGSSQKAWNGALLPDTTGQRWHYIPDVWGVNPNTVAFTVRLDQDAYLAMRVPYGPSYSEKFLRSIANPAAQLIEVGKSRQGRPLLLLKIGTGDERTKPCVLIYAAEHADEPDGSWIAQGAIDFLLSTSSEARRLRENFTLMFVPLLDPDSTARSRHEGIITSFWAGHTTPEAISYASWFERWIEAGKRLDLVFDLHNVQSRESPHLACALLEGGARGPLAGFINEAVVKAFRARSMDVADAPWNTGTAPPRLGGWIGVNYGAMMIAYEFNSQEASSHWSISTLRGLGRDLVSAGAEALVSPSGQRLLKDIDSKRQQRLEAIRQLDQGLSRYKNAIDLEASIAEKLAGKDSRRQ